MNLLGITKALTEGLAVAFAAYFIPCRKTGLLELMVIALTATATFMILDYLAPEVGLSARQGAGFGIGLNQMGWQSGGFEDCEFTCANNPKKCSDMGPCEQDKGSESESVGGGHDEWLGSESGSASPVKCGRSQPNWAKCSAPIDVSFNKEPYGIRGFGTQYSSTNVGSRPMNFTEYGCPVNSNIHEFRLVPGLYSKYALRAGYNQNVEPYNEIEFREPHP